MARCCQCGHLWLNPRPAVSELEAIYPPTYYAYSYETAINPVARRAKAVLDAAKLRGILRSLDHAPRSYLDIGCGDGRFLRAMRAKGMSTRDIYGLELDGSVVANLSQDGFQVHQARVEDADAIPVGAVDLITMFHVLEHVPNPVVTVRRIVEWLSPGGVCAIETPNTDSMDARLFADGYWGGYHFPRHWHLFSTANLSSLLAREGLEVVVVRYQPGHSFWMWSVHHWLRYGRRQQRLANRFNPFTGLIPIAGFTAFDKVRIALHRRTSAVLVVARKPPVPAPDGRGPAGLDVAC